MAEKFRAYAAFEPKGSLQPFEYDPGELGPEQIEIQVDYCGLCHSDLSMLNNDWAWTDFPFVGGHEVVGKIIALGENAKGLDVGDSVGSVPEPIPVSSFNLIGGAHSVSGSATGSPGVVRKMVDFCARHNIEAVTEIFPMSQINSAFEHLGSGKARYRVVLESDF